MGREVVIITGASGSIGSEVVRAMAADGFDVIMACRNVKKGEAVRAALLADIPSARLEVRQVELSSFASIRAFASAGKEENISVLKLFNNAGVINRYYSVTSDGYENTLAVNYLAPCLLIHELLPLFAVGASIVNMVSVTRFTSSLKKDFFECNPHKFSQLGTYGKTKYALLVYSAILSAKMHDLHINVSDPGVVDSNMISMGRWFDPIADILFRPFCKKPSSGAIPAVNALRSEKSGFYFKGAKKSFKIPEKILNHPLAAWLESETEKKIASSSGYGK